MQVSRKYASLWKIASTDQSRHVLMHLAVKRTGEETGFVEATDGRRLVRVPVEFAKDETFPPIVPQDKPCQRVYLTVQVWKQGFKDTPKSLDAVFSFPADGQVKTLANTTYSVPKIEDLSWPNADQVIPDARNWKRIQLTSFDARYAAEINEVVGNGKSDIFTVAQNANNLYDAILFGSCDANEIGLLMPCREQGHKFGKLDLSSLGREELGVIRNPAHTSCEMKGEELKSLYDMLAAASQAWTDMQADPVATDDVGQAKERKNKARMLAREMEALVDFWNAKGWTAADVAN